MPRIPPWTETRLTLKSFCAQYPVNALKKYSDPGLTSNGIICSGIFYRSMINQGTNVRKIKTSMIFSLSFSLLEKPCGKLILFEAVRSIRVLWLVDLWKFYRNTLEFQGMILRPLGYFVSTCLRITLRRNRVLGWKRGET